MNYLVIEGYKDAAEQFAQEAQLAPPVDLESIQDRMRIRQAVQCGGIEEAVERVNDLDAEVRAFPCGWSVCCNAETTACRSWTRIRSCTSICSSSV